MLDSTVVAWGLRVERAARRPRLEPGSDRSQFKKFSHSGDSQSLGGNLVGTKKTGKGRRKIGRKKRRMRSKIRHRKG